LVVDREGSLLPTGYAASTLHTPEKTMPLFGRHLGVSQ
jgi:hypothetical protein